MNVFHAPYRVSQPYGPTNLAAEPAYGGYKNFHRGIDIVGPSDACPIYAAVPGVVYNCGTDVDGAKYVIELADTGHFVCYWHLSNITVVRGRRIDNTVQIGNQGSTGNSTASHLHLEVELPGTWIGLLKMTPTDPNPFLQDKEDEVTQEEHDKQMGDLRLFYERVIVDSFIELLAQQQPNTYDKDARQHHIDFVHNNVGGQIQVGQGFIDAYGWQNGSAIAAINADWQKKLTEALQNAPQPVQQPSKPVEQDCQQQADEAVQVALEKLEADPLVKIALALRKLFGKGGE